MWLNIAYIANLAFESFVGIIGIRLYEEPSYEIVARLRDRVEIRRYAPRLAAEVVISGAGKAKMEDAFRLLFAYIAGANQAKEKGGSTKIAMTVPVEVHMKERLAMTVPVQVSETGDSVRMLFYLPSNVSADAAPKPADGRVRIVTVPGETIASLRFSGSVDISHARQLELIGILKESRWRPMGTPYLLGYDPPFTLPFLRRNEVAVEVSETR
jgi:hypothetical protein